MKIYSIKYTDGDIPLARDPITIASGKMRSVEVPFPSEGSLTRVVLSQSSGTNVECKIRLLDSSVPYPAGIYNSGTAAADKVELYEIISQQTAASGAVLVFDEEYGFPFHNQDGESFTDNRRYIYVILEPTSALTSTTWKLALTCRTEVG